MLEGTVTVFCGDEEIHLAAGDYGFVPRGLPHAYLVTSEHARMLVTFSPSGFEEVFVAFGAPVDGGPPPEDAVMPAPDEFARLLAPYGCEIVGPPRPSTERSDRHRTPNAIAGVDGRHRADRLLTVALTPALVG